MEKAVAALHAKHERRIRNAKSLVDNSPPRILAYNFLRLSKLHEDAINYTTLMKRNMILLTNIIKIHRTCGRVSSFRTPVNMRSQNENAKRRRMHALEKENFRLGIRLFKVHGLLNTRWDTEMSRRKKKAKKLEKFTVPDHILQKYNIPVKIPMPIELAKKCFRPVVFFDLEIFNVRPLGRIILEFYTEAAPQIVLEFVRMCQKNDSSRLQFTRIFPSLWMEADLKISDIDIMRGRLEYDMRALNNGECGGIMSCPLFSREPTVVHVAISFKPLAVANGKRIAFARIKEGFHIIEYIQDLGTKNGKPTKEIIMSNCGLLTK